MLSMVRPWNLNHIKQELASFQQVDDGNNLEVTIVPDEKNVLQWAATMRIAEGDGSSPFEGGVFKLKINFPKDFPCHAPKIRFLTKVFHPNVYTDGSICLDILNSSGWSSKFNMKLVIAALRQFLDEPNPSSPANFHAAQLYETKRDEYNERVKKFINAQLNGDPVPYDSDEDDGVTSDEDGNYNEHFFISRRRNIRAAAALRRRMENRIRRHQFLVSNRFQQDFQHLTAQIESNPELANCYQNLTIRQNKEEFLLAFQGTFFGPVDTRFAYQHFSFQIRFQANTYPTSNPPSVTFQDLSHPNFSATGQLNSHLLLNWESQREPDRLKALLLFIKSLFYQPNVDFVVNQAAMAVFYPPKPTLARYAKLRLEHEVASWRTKPVKGISINPISNDMIKWLAVIASPSDSPFCNENFDLLIEIPDQYPFYMPLIRFATPILHPNVHSDGTVPLLAKFWTPAIGLMDLLVMIREFLRDPVE